ncbi:MAG: cytidylate kinase-like family protein [Verrucomicrobia bacterium]|jgi:cytidylate kinase|nr:cytidylate kinase-like family protein [Verrucomicrobiota bacterium]
MWKNIGFDQCLTFINCQLEPVRPHGEPAVRPAITISRMTGAGGRTVAAELAAYLQARVPIQCQWTVFDKGLMERVLEDHHLSRRVSKYEPEAHKPFLQDAMEEILGLHPSTWTIVQQTQETILKLASMGFVILVGRASNVVTAKLDNAFHVRLVGSLEHRTRRAQEVYHLEPKAALEFVKTEDKGRRRYLKDHYQKEIDDPLLYDLVLNTDRLRYEDAARLIGEAVIHRFRLTQRTPAASAV